MKFHKYIFSLAMALTVAISICSTAHAYRPVSKPEVFASEPVAIDSLIAINKTGGTGTQDAVAKDDDAWDWDANELGFTDDPNTEDSVFDTQLPSPDVVQVPEPNTLILGVIAGLSTLFRRKK